MMLSSILYSVFGTSQTQNQKLNHSCNEIRNSSNIIGQTRVIMSVILVVKRISTTNYAFRSNA